MRVISPLLKRVVYPGLSKAGYFRRALPGGVAVLTYHGVVPCGYECDEVMDGCLVTPQAFRQQLQLLKSEYHVISPADFLSFCEFGTSLPPRSVLLTCDDGLRTAVCDMLPVLDEVDLKCLFFIVGESLEEAPAMLWHEELYLMLLSPRVAEVQLPGLLPRTAIRDMAAKRDLWSDLLVRFSRLSCEVRQQKFEDLRGQLNLDNDWADRFLTEEAYQRRFLVMQRDDIARLLAAGMTIGAHSLSHPILAEMPSDLAFDEIAVSKDLLERRFGVTAWAFAYPFGDAGAVTSRELEMASRSGYACAFVNVGGGFGAECPQFAIPRIHVRRDMSLGEFEAHLSGFHRNLREKFVRESGEMITA